MKCPNLRQLFGDRYRVIVGESYHADTGNQRRVGVDPWYYVLLCHNGQIVPWGPDLLAACTSRRGPVANKLVAAGCEVVQNADDGVNATFPVEAFNEVAEIMRPRKRRRLTDEQRVESADRLRRYRLETQAQSPQNDELRSIRVPDGSVGVAG